VRHRLNLAASAILALFLFFPVVYASAQVPAEIQLTKTGPATANAGEQVTYTLTVRFNAAQASTLYTLTDVLPLDARFVALTPNAPLPWSCVTPSVGSTGSVTCTRSTAIPAGDVSTFTLVVRLCSDIGCGGALGNNATLTASGFSTSANATLLVTKQADLSVTKSGPATTQAGNNVTYTINFANAGPSDAASTTLTDLLPAGWTIVSATPSTGSCSGIGTGTLSCNLGTLGTATGQCSNSFPSNGTVSLVAHVPAVAPPGPYTNTATIQTSGCTTDNNPENNSASVTTQVTQTPLGPGVYYPARSAVSDTKPGSVLFYNFYTSDPADPVSSNTRISMTNVNPTAGVALHLFFVDGATCSVADRFLCLTPNQTTSFLMSEMDPGTSGYLVAVAVDGPGGFGLGPGTGCPISFNYLIGSSSLKLSFSPRREDEVEAESAAAEYGSPVPGCDPNSFTATLVFDGSANGYNRLPRVLALDNIPSRADGNDTYLVINRIGGNFTSSGASLGAMFGLLFDDAEQPHSFNLSTSACQLRGSLGNTFPRTTPRFEQVIPAGASGWLKLWAVNDFAILGVSINRNDNKRTAANAFEGAHNLHKLRLVPSVSLIVPVFPPSC
jgi:uncharacterized repeat protein (TIGR01451 family)